MNKKYYEEIEKEIKELEKIKNKLEKTVKPKNYGRIEVNQRNGKSYYMLVNSNGRKYIPLSESKLIKENLQYAYDMKVKRIVERKLQAWDMLKKYYDNREIKDIYPNLHPGRKSFISPIVESDEQYLARWLNQPISRNPYEFKSDIFSNRDEQMRSKSEKTIADWLIAHNIPYRYEGGIYLKSSNAWVFPDFTLLNVSQRKEIYWEHLGRMDDADYVKKNLRKIKMYEKEGIVVGKNLILTFETSDMVLDSRRLAKIIEPYWE